MAKKKKYYVVWHGHQTGVFDSWADCQRQIKGFPNAIYKSFGSLDEAKEAYGGQAADFIGVSKSSKPKKKAVSESARQDIRWESISVDAACSGNPGLMEYRGVDTANGDEIFRVGPLRQGTNNVGEFLALVHGLAYLQKQQRPDYPIYSDSRTAMSWVRRKKANTQLKRTAANAKIFELIHRATVWLRDNRYQNPILKWNTEEWGEIPADFGRK
ncbi:MAG: viroplasmin family protein [Bacteroidota bacterium]